MQLLERSSERHNRKPVGLKSFVSTALDPGKSNHSGFENQFYPTVVAGKTKFNFASSSTIQTIEALL
jgi:hypothetical protein